MNDLNDPTQNPENYKFGLLYFNSKDSRYIVPKRTASTGWAINFAKPRTYLVVLLVILIIIYFKQ